MMTQIKTAQDVIGNPDIVREYLKVLKEYMANPPEQHGPTADQARRLNKYHIRKAVIAEAFLILYNRVEKFYEEELEKSE